MMDKKQMVLAILSIFFLIGCEKQPTIGVNPGEVAETSKFLGSPISEAQARKQIDEQGITLKSKNGTTFEYTRDGKLTHVENEAFQPYSQEDIDRNRGKFPTKARLEELRKVFVPEEYTGVRKEVQFEGDYVGYTYYKENPWGIENRYQGVEFFFPTFMDYLDSISIYNDYDVTEAPKISGEEATETARRFLQEVLGEKAKGEPKELKLLVRPSIGYFDDFLTKEEKEKAKELFGGYGKKGFHVDYHVWFGDTIVFVDAYDGSIVDGDYYVSDAYDDANDVASDG